MKVGAIVILYQPDRKVIENIKSYLEQVDLLYAVDNSEYKDRKNQQVASWLKRQAKIRYLDNHRNKGIAQAMNRGIKNAMREGCTWFLTLDQDSRATEGMLEKMKQFILENATDGIGIVTAFQESVNEHSRTHTREIEKLKWTITSGNLINRKAYRKCGGFREELFIDSVDFEYSMRLKINGFDIIRLNRAVLQHKLGETRYINGRGIAVHAPERMYYRVRNAYYVRNLYKNKCQELSDEIFGFTMESCRSDLQYGDCRLRQLLYMIKGYLAYRTGHMGK